MTGQRVAGPRGEMTSVYRDWLWSKRQSGSTYQTPTCVTFQITIIFPDNSVFQTMMPFQKTASFKKTGLFREQYFLDNDYLRF